MELDRVNLPSAGDDTIRRVESEASGSRQPEVLRGQQLSTVYVRRARNSTSSGTREEEEEGSRQPLSDERSHQACETTLQRRRMNEQLRHYAGLPSSISSEGGTFVLSDSSDSNHRTDVVLGAANQGLFASASGDTDADRSSTWPAPSLLQAWDQSNVWERSFVRGQSSAGPTLVRTSLSSGESSGVSAPETRRSSGRRLWDALSKATFHRRSSTLTTAALADLEENSMPLGDVEQLVDTETLHGSRSLDLEERRRRVRSQVWALRRLSNGLDGTSWHARSCAGNHHGHRCSCEGHDMGDDTDTRASISRIIMLAEALFEVLDEIHRQSTALSQPATVPLASRAAPTSVVDAIPLRTHCKPVDDCDEAPHSGGSSRRLSSSELESSSNLAAAAAAAGASASNSQSSPPCHMELDRVNLLSAGDDTIRRVESEASGSRQPEVLRGQQLSTVYVRRARNSTSSGTREEEEEGSRQPLSDERSHHACETTLQRRRMNEQLRHYAGLPSSISSEGGTFVLSDSSDSNHRTDVVLGAANQGLFASASGDTDADRSSTWPAPSLLQAWDQSNVWERSFVRGQSSAGPTLVRTSLSSGESSGVSAPETRRSSGRRLWDALSRATFHRRSSTLTTAALADLEENSMPLGDVEQLVDTETLHGSRSLDLEERRRRVRSQVWALRRLSNGLDGTSWHARSCAGNHHGHRCSCEGHDMGDDTDTRASISRIIMLAEALFEVLDEIHRQSTALSQPATVPLASRAAPTSVVDAIPLRTHCKPVDDCDEAPQ